MPCHRASRRLNTSRTAIARGRGSALDAIVVGAGPAGIAATLRLKEAGLNTELLDQEELGGSILHYPRAKVTMAGTLDIPMFGESEEDQDDQGRSARTVARDRSTDRSAGNGG